MGYYIAAVTSPSRSSSDLARARFPTARGAYIAPARRTPACLGLLLPNRGIAHVALPLLCFPAVAEELGELL